jgi:hypothetical protein
MDRADLLKKADDLIKGDRAKDYGDAYQNHDKIAIGWNVIAKSAFESHGRITASHVALMMDWVKTARLLNTIDHEEVALMMDRLLNKSTTKVDRQGRIHRPWRGILPKGQKVKRGLYGGKLADGDVRSKKRMDTPDGIARHHNRKKNCYRRRNERPRY